MLVSDDTEGEDPKYLVMADDGKGGSVRIPSMLISSSNGQKLKESIHEYELYGLEDNEKDLQDDEDFTVKTPDSGLSEIEENASHQSNQVII